MIKYKRLYIKETNCFIRCMIDIYHNKTLCIFIVKLINLLIIAINKYFSELILLLHIFIQGKSYVLSRKNLHKNIKK